MKDFMNKRMAILQSMENTTVKINTIVGDVNLSAEGKKAQVEPLTAEVATQIHNAINDLQAGLITQLHSVKHAHDKAVAVESSEVAAKAATMAPALSTMDYSSIMRLYEARSGDAVERTVIEQVALLRIDADPHSGDKELFMSKFNQASQKLYEQLPGYDEIVSAQAGEQYLHNLNKLLNYNLREWQGETLPGVDQVGRRMALFEIEQYEKALT